MGFLSRFIFCNKYKSNKLIVIFKDTVKQIDDFRVDVEGKGSVKIFCE